MPEAQPQDHEKWLSLQDASRQLGVSPATLRHWADRGKVQVFRTPGGHRRFSEQQLKSLSRDRSESRGARDLDRLIHSALGRARLDISSGLLDGEAWYQGLDESGRQAHRVLGRLLMTLLIDTLHDSFTSTELELRADELGHRYGLTSREEGIPVRDTLRAFLFFRDYIFEDLIDVSSSPEYAGGPDPLLVYRRLNRIVNRILVAMVDVSHEPGPKV